jgi:Uma2 family endonuclease
MSSDNRLPRRDDANTVKEQTEAYEPFERYEIIHGIRYDFQPSASFVHQILVTKLGNAMDSSCHPNGIVVVAPMDVHMNENTVQPDIVFIRNENIHIVKNQRIEGVPDLLMEILSPSTGKHDRSRKKALYEAFGVKEYWIVDPLHYTIEQFELNNDGCYLLRAIYGEGDTMSSDTLSCVDIDVDRLFETAKRFENT